MMTDGEAPLSGWTDTMRSAARWKPGCMRYMDRRGEGDEEDEETRDLGGSNRHSNSTRNSNRDRETKVSKRDKGREGRDRENESAFLYNTNT